MNNNRWKEWQTHGYMDVKSHRLMLCVLSFPHTIERWWKCLILVCCLNLLKI
jgi:hypothetical protein